MDTAPETNGKEGNENKNQCAVVEEKNPMPPPQEAQPKKSKREEMRTKKDDKNIEQFMKSLNSVPTLEEKLSLVCKKYVQTADENKTLHFYVKQSDKRYALLLKEKDHLQLECNKTVLVKSKLENLCRELQKQNKAIKEESLLKIREEEERRKETQAKFQNTLAEITTLLQQNNEKNAKLRDDNISMSEKFKSVLQQYQLREQQVDKMAQQMTLESQLSDAKLQKANLEFRAEKERLLAEMEKLKLETEQYKAKIMELQNAETLLRSQIDVYTGKYDEFQNALQRSNQVFVGFKGEMEKMSKKIQKLEKESLMWKRRWETSQASLLQVCTEKQASDENVASTQRHLDQMQRLCRTLQGERTLLLNTLKEHNIERPPLPPPAPLPPSATAPASAPAHSNKVETMAANCVQLRQSLAELQNQLNVLTNKSQAKEEQKPEKQKKTKSRKKKDNVKSDTQAVADNESVEHTPPPGDVVPTTESINAETTVSEPLMEQLNELTSMKFDVPLNELIKEEKDKLTNVTPESTDERSNLGSGDAAYSQDDKTMNMKQCESINEISGKTLYETNDKEIKEKQNDHIEKVVNDFITDTKNDEIPEEETGKTLDRSSTNEEIVVMSNVQSNDTICSSSDIIVDNVLNEISNDLLTKGADEVLKKINKHIDEEPTNDTNIENEMLAELVSIIKSDKGDLGNLIDAIQESNQTLDCLETTQSTSSNESVKTDGNEVTEVPKKNKDGKRMTKPNIESIYEASTPSNVSLIEAASNDEVGQIEEIKSILDVSNSQS